MVGREDAHVKDWAEFGVCLVSKNGDISWLSHWRPISLVPTLYKPLPDQLVVRLPAGPALSRHYFLLDRSVAQSRSVGRETVCRLHGVESAFDTVRAGRNTGRCVAGARRLSLLGGCSGQGNVELALSAVPGKHVQSGCGLKTGRSQDAIKLEAAWQKFVRQYRVVWRHEHLLMYG